MKKILVLLTAVFFVSNVFAQWSQFGPSNGTNGQVNALYRFRNKLYACGYFPCPLRNGVTTMTFSTCSPVLQFHQSVAGGFIEYNHKLLCYGSFDSEINNACSPNQGSLTMWFDGTNWCADGAITSGGYVSTAVVYQGQLYIGGLFNFIDVNGKQVSGIAKWNGIQWVSPGFYLGTTTGATQVNSLCVFQNKLYVGGLFNKVNNTTFTSPNILTWNGTTTAPVGTGLTNINSQYTTCTTSLVVYQNELWIAGYFAIANGSSANGLVKYTGTAYIPVPFVLRSFTITLAVHQGRLYISQNGNQSFSGTVTVPWRLFSYNGVTTQSEESGLYFDTPDKSVLSIYSDTISKVLYIGGNISKSSMGSGINYIASRGVVSLPVKLTSFSCSAKENAITLKWETASEINNDHFEIERSTDAETFESVGEVHGAGTTSQTNEHIFLDNTALPGVTYYYRLKQVDFDGVFEESILISCSTTAPELSFEVIPRLVTRNLIIKTQSVGEIFLYDISGREVHHEVSSGLVNYDMAPLSPGMYMVLFRTNTQFLTQRIYKQ